MAFTAKILSLPAQIMKSNMWLQSVPDTRDQVLSFHKIKGKLFSDPKFDWAVPNPKADCHHVAT